MKKKKNIAYGIAIGTVIGVLTDNLGLSICLGLAIGSEIEFTLMDRNKKDNNNTS